jgi:hypothetical protein
VLLLCDISLYSAVKQQLKYNTGKVFNCLNQFLLPMVLSTEERVLLVGCVFIRNVNINEIRGPQYSEFWDYSF